MSPSSKYPSQQSKAVLVTGAAKRLGREIALQFARQGWDVAVHYGRLAQEAAKTADEIQGLGVKVEAFQADLSNEIQTNGLFKTVSEVFPHLECPVNIAHLYLNMTEVIQVSH